MTINGFDTDALAATVTAVTDSRELGEVTFAVAGEWQGGVRLQASTGALSQAGVKDQSRIGQFPMSSDEPAALLGNDTAASPAEYLLQALASCYTVTLVANASARGIKLNSYKLELEADLDLSGFLGIDPDVIPGVQAIRVKIDVEAPEADRADLEKLVRVVEQRSPIRDTLTRGVAVTTSLV